MFEIASIAIVVYAVVVGFLFVAQRSMMYQPGSVLPDPSATLLGSIEERRIETPDGLPIRSWFSPPQDERPIVLYFQGNAGTIADRDFKVAPWIADGVGVWLLGYRGFGGNPGSPTENGLYADAMTAVETLSDEGFAPSQIVLYGESLGSGVATEVAFRLAKAGTPARGLILEAPFSSMGAAAQDHYPFVPAKLLVRDKFQNDAKIASINTPLLILHGDRDRVVKQKHGKRLFDLAEKPKLGYWPKGAAHNNLYDFGSADVVRQFLDE